jgi:hypothetical protein
VKYARIGTINEIDEEAVRAFIAMEFWTARPRSGALPVVL